MAEETKKLARDIRVQIYSKPVTVRNGSGAYVSSVQIAGGNRPTAKAAAKKPAARKAAKRKTVARKK